MGRDLVVGRRDLGAEKGMWVRRRDCGREKVGSGWRTILNFASEDVQLFLMLIISNVFLCMW